MNIRGVSLCSSIAASMWAVLAGPASAAPSDLCAAPAVGVPSRPGPPKWFAWASGDDVDPNVDDPRWLQATGKNFQFTASGGALAPVETRALWANEGGQQFLYLSFLINVTPAGTITSTTGRDLYIGFRPPVAFDPTVLDSTYTGGPENAYILQLHLDAGAGGASAPIQLDECLDDTTCGELGTTPRSFYRVFVDHGVNGISCAQSTGGTIVGRSFPQMQHDPATPTPTDPPTWVKAAVGAWKLDASPSFPTLKNQWALELRIPVVDPATTPNANIRQGVVKGSSIWYELTANLTSNRTSIAAWPRDLTTHVCQRRSGGNVSLVHNELGDPTKWSALTTFSGNTAPSDCAGIALAMENIGSVFNPVGGTDFATAPLTTEIKAFTPTSTPAPNEVVARIHNTSGAPISGNFIARFRLATWGAQSVDPTRYFRDVRVAKNGVCAAGDAPNCTAVPVPPLPSGAMPICGTSGGVDNCVAMHASWQLGTGTDLNGFAVDASEYCQYGITPPGGTCQPCQCSLAGAHCDDTGDHGTQAVIGGSTTPLSCRSQYAEHECIVVDVDAPSSNVDFVSRSNWNNMEFRGTSKMAQVATVDVRGLPTAPGQRFHDVYLVVMPRNMPASTGAPVTGVDLIRQHTDEAINTLVRPYAQDLEKMKPQARDELRAKLARHGIVIRRPQGVGGDSYGGSGYGGGLPGRKPNEQELRLMQIAPYMSDDDFAKAQALLDLALVPDGQGQAELATHQAVQTLGPSEAANVVPTLDIYAFYRADPETVKDGALYLPMTSFSVFLFHNDTPMTGMRWELDGFKKVGENIYHEHIPVGRVRRIQVRAQSIEGSESPIPPGNANWPGGCCGGARGGTYAGVSSTAPGLIAGAFVFGSRRRRKRKSKQA